MFSSLDRRVSRPFRNIQFVSNKHFFFLKELLVIESGKAEVEQEHVSSLRVPFVFCRENKAEHL